MKISIAQTRSIKGDIAFNSQNHIKLIEIAASLGADAIFFPELSLTGYEPNLAKDLAINLKDSRLKDFQLLSNKHFITIGLGVPTISKLGILISMIIFQPNESQKVYSKQLLHSDELPFFTNGEGQIILNVNNRKIAPAICYESLQPNHFETANQLGAEVYLASVAKPQKGIDKAMVYYPEVAKKYSIPVFMSNCVGFCDNFESFGNSAVWTKEGTIAGQLDNNNEGLLIFDMESEEAQCILAPF
jgi:predicted amidohydrolase